jgi:hypothetical protein
MLIANPIYDAVFKYLLSDLKVAKLMLSVLSEKEIVELDFMPTEIFSKERKVPFTKEEAEILKMNTGIIYFRIDFAAKVKDENGNETQVIIELQKARLLSTMRRFRNYLGEQYRNSNLFVMMKTNGGYSYEAGIPIYAIYFLGYELDGFENTSVVSIQNFVYDFSTRESLDKTQPFVQSLFHEGKIVIIPNLTGRHRNRLEKMLKIFEGSEAEAGLHLLELNPEDYPEEFRDIILRLVTAAADSQTVKAMEVEDEILRELSHRESLLETAKKNEAKAREEAEILAQKLRKAVFALKESGTNEQQIAEILQISEEEVRDILHKPQANG